MDMLGVEETTKAYQKQQIKNVESQKPNGKKIRTSKLKQKNVKWLRKLLLEDAVLLWCNCVQRKMRFTVSAHYTNNSSATIQLTLNFIQCLLFFAQPFCRFAPAYSFNSNATKKINHIKTIEKSAEKNAIQVREKRIKITSNYKFETANRRRNQKEKIKNDFVRNRFIFISFCNEMQRKNMLKLEIIKVIATI